MEQFLVSVCVMAAEVTASTNADSRLAGICFQVRLRALGGGGVAVAGSAPAPCRRMSLVHEVARSDSAPLSRSMCRDTLSLVLVVVIEVIVVVIVVVVVVVSVVALSLPPMEFAKEPLRIFRGNLDVHVKIK